MNRRFLIVSLLSVGVVAGVNTLAGAAGADPAPSAVPPKKTGKERLSDKASDEQRVDDCNVPPERRGTSLRPSACGRRRHPVTPASGATSMD